MCVVGSSYALLGGFYPETALCRTTHGKLYHVTRRKVRQGRGEMGTSRALIAREVREPLQGGDLPAVSGWKAGTQLSKHLSQHVQRPRASNRCGWFKAQREVWWFLRESNRISPQFRS